MKKIIFATAFVYFSFVSFVSASTTVVLSPTSGSDFSSGVEEVFDGSDLAKVLSSDDSPRLQTSPWPDAGSYDEARYLEFVFSGSIPTGATILNATLSHEFRRSAALGGAKMEVFDGTSFSDISATTGTINVDHIDSTDVTSLLDTPEKINAFKARFLAYRNSVSASGTTTSHDYISLSVTYNVPVVSPDTVAPIITLSGSTNVSINESATYTDAGATALDDVDGDITSNIVVNNSVDTNTPGTYLVTYNVVDTAGNSASTVTRTVTVVPVSHETVLIRNGGTVIFDDTINLPDAGTVTITDSDGNPHSVYSRSVLGFIYSISQMPDSGFSLSTVQYFSSFNSLYLKCLTILPSTELCDNWQFVVDNATPWTSMDTTILSGGEYVGLYFGTPHQVIFDTTSINPGGSFTATAQNYNYLTDTWSPLTGVTIGATQPNPLDPWNPTVITTGAVDGSGQATLTLTELGTYNVGIAEDYYFPSYVVNVISSSGGGSGGGNGGSQFSIPNALGFLIASQDTDGSFGGLEMYSDWVALALGATDTTGSIRTKLISYYTANNNIHSLVTDNERHAMALLALGQNPYSFGGKNFISPIVSSFDGNQIGDSALVNDDIFGVIVLPKAGYQESEDIISKSVAYILSKQLGNGSWENSVDVTAAGIVALSQFSSLPGVNSALTNAQNYIQSQQSTTGGWSNVSTSAWAFGAMNSVGANWTKGGKTPTDYFGTVQATDGGTTPETDTMLNRIWATSYAVSAVSGKTWITSMQSVAKPQNGTTGTKETEEKKTETKTEEKKVEEVKVEEEKKTEEEKIEKTIEEIAPIQKIQTTKVATLVDKEQDTEENTPELTANVLGAVGNTKNTPSNTIPIVLAVGSGLIVVYVVVRKFI